MMQLSGYGKFADGTPHINGKPASRCDCPADSCPGVLMPGSQSPWLCPECGAHLSPSGICLNACHLTAAQLRKFEQGLREAAAAARSRHNGEIYARARALYDEAQQRWPQAYTQTWEQLGQREQGRWVGESCMELGTAIW